MCLKTLKLCQIVNIKQHFLKKCQSLNEQCVNAKHIKHLNLITSGKFTKKERYQRQSASESMSLVTENDLGHQCNKNLL